MTITFFTQLPPDICEYIWSFVQISLQYYEVLHEIQTIQHHYFVDAESNDVHNLTIPRAMTNTVTSYRWDTVGCHCCDNELWATRHHPNECGVVTGRDILMLRCVK